MTFNTLKGLKNRGVKVELGFPYEMWDTPDAEVTRLKSRVRIFNIFLQKRYCLGTVIIRYSNMGMYHASGGLQILPNGSHLSASSNLQSLPVLENYVLQQL